MPEKTKHERLSPEDIDLTDSDIYEAMKSIPGYLDITPGDFKELYRYAYQHALARITESVTAKDIMVREVVRVAPDTPLSEVAEIMGARGISGVPVVDLEGKVLGVISEKDFLSRMGAKSPQNFMMVIANCLRAKGCIALPIRAHKAKDIMTSPAITVTEQTSSIAIAQLFSEKAINRVPVVDQADHLVGLVSRADIVQATHLASCKILNP